MNKAVRQLCKSRVARGMYMRFANHILREIVVDMPLVAHITSEYFTPLRNIVFDYQKQSFAKIIISCQDKA